MLPKIISHFEKTPIKNENEFDDCVLKQKGQPKTFTCDGVVDAVCVGVPDPRLGHIVCAIVEPRAGTRVDPAAVAEHVRAGLAHYKAPRIVLERSTIGRAPNGKVDYKGLTAWARDQVAAG